MFTWPSHEPSPERFARSCAVRSRPSNERESMPAPSSARIVRSRSVADVIRASRRKSIGELPPLATSSGFTPAASRPSTAQVVIDADEAWPGVAANPPSAVLRSGQPRPAVGGVRARIGRVREAERDGDSREHDGEHSRRMPLELQSLPKAGDHAHQGGAGCEGDREVAGGVGGVEGNPARGQGQVPVKRLLAAVGDHDRQVEERSIDEAHPRARERQAQAAQAPSSDDREARRRRGPRSPSLPSAKRSTAPARARCWRSERRARRP